MGIGAKIALAICDGGGSEVGAEIAVFAVLGLWLLGVWALICVDTDLVERLSLLALLLSAILIGGFLLLYPHGTSGNGDYLQRFLLGPPLCGLLGFVVAIRTRVFGLWRGLFVGIVGDLFVPGSLFLLFFASVGIGNGCLG